MSSGESHEPVVVHRFTGCSTLRQAPHPFAGCLTKCREPDSSATSMGQYWPRSVASPLPTSSVPWDAAAQVGHAEVVLAGFEAGPDGLSLIVVVESVLPAQASAQAVATIANNEVGVAEPTAYDKYGTDCSSSRGASSSPGGSGTRPAPPQPIRPVPGCQ